MIERNWRSAPGSAGTVAIINDAALFDEDRLVARVVANDRLIGTVQEDYSMIAAAPDLLEACETALANLKPMYASDHLVIRRLSDAIAKAKPAR